MSAMFNSETSLELRRGDWFLTTLVNLANSGALEMGVTLLVGGLLVSGTLVGGATYFEGFSRSFYEGFSSSFPDDPEVSESVRSSFAQLGLLYPSSGDGNTSLPPPEFIHLKQAKFFTPGNKPTPDNQGVWWRGRLSEISGFHLGNLSWTPA